MSEEELRLRRRSERERAARKQAEALLEQKSRELWDANLELRGLAESLEERVRQRTAELERAREEALAASRAKSEFLANMSHEIRTPLNGVLGFAHLMLDGELGSMERECAEMIRFSGEGLLALINDILDLSKIEAGRLTLEAIPFELASVFEVVRGILKPRADEKELTLDLELDPDLPAYVSGDPLRLRQILLNLVGNALKFTERGGVTIRVRAERADTGAAWLACEVVDTGIGIPADRMDSIFEPFLQADGSTSRRFGGTGLGLAICQRLVDMMGGSIGVSSELGQGSCFCVRLPLVADLESLAPVQPSSTAPGVPTGLRVLLAEDNPVNRRLMVHLLERDGHRVHCAENGAEALELIEREVVDVVLMDVQMPEVDGLEATLRLRRREAGTGGHLPIVALTAHALQGDRERLLEAGMDDYLSKPVDVSLLRQCLAHFSPAPSATPSEL